MEIESACSAKLQRSTTDWRLTLIFSTVEIAHQPGTIATMKSATGIEISTIQFTAALPANLVKIPDILSIGGVVLQ